MWTSAVAAGGHVSFGIEELFPAEITLAGGAKVRQADTGGHWLDFLAGGPELVITFESRGQTGPDASRPFWGHSYLQKRQFSVLGVKARQSDWFRDDRLHALFWSDRFRQFAGQFSRCIFMGGSMGGYAALAFARVVPGALVLAHNPQSTLDPRIVPWDKRFPDGLRQDWRGDFADAAAGGWRRAYVTYDPFETPDRRHLERLPAGAVIPLKLPFLGHGIPEWLSQMKLLSAVTDLALNETLTPEMFARMARARRSITHYYINLCNQTARPRFKAVALAKGFEHEPGNARLSANAVILDFNQRRYEDCVARFRGIRTLNRLPPGRQGLVRAYAGLAMVYTGAPQAEIEQILDRIDDNSLDSSELVITGRLLNEIGQFARAERLLRSAVAIAPTLFPAYHQLALSQEALNKSRECLLTLHAAKKACKVLGPQASALLTRMETLVGTVSGG